MHKNYLIVLFSIFLFLVCSPKLGNAAEIGSLIKVGEIGPDYIKGSFPGEETLIIYKNETVIGQGKAINQFYELKLSQTIPNGTELTIKAEGTEQQTKVVFTPPVLNQVDDKTKIISGTIKVGATVSARYNDQLLNLKSLNNGIFEFQSSFRLKYGSEIEVVSEFNGVKSILSTKVLAAPAPDKPKISLLSNKSITLTGNAEPDSIVNILIGKNTYKIKVDLKGNFKFDLPNRKPMPAGTVISVFATADRFNSKSGTLTIRVADQIPPASPRVNKVTNKSFLISGTAEPYSNVYILKNTKPIKVVKANQKGSFSISVPLQTVKTKYEFYSKDAAGNQGGKSAIVVENQNRPAAKMISAPLVRQMPELPRGCEVTSLTMLLNHAGVKANKMTLAKQVKKDPTPLKVIKGKKYFGNPHLGFVGDMYSFRKPGFGVFNKPVEALANSYMPGRIVNLSGLSFDSVLDYVAAGRPVWVINTSWFSIVPSKYWQTWYTPQGIVRITMKEHSVLVTGYDSKYVYFNDPLDGKKNKKWLKKHFIDGWTQYGKQAISYY